MKEITMLLDSICPQWKSRTVNHPVIKRPQLAKQDIDALRVALRAGQFISLIGAGRADRQFVLIDGVPYKGYK